MRHSTMVGAAAALVALCGCLTMERASYRITYDRDKKLGTVEARYENLQSDEKDLEAQRRDFDQLMESLRGERYLMEQVRYGRYVKERRLEVRGGKLVADETALIGDLASADLVEDSTGAVVWTDKDFEVIRANGRVGPGRDSVWWAAGTSRFEFEVRNRDFQPRSDFVKWFKARR